MQNPNLPQSQPPLPATPQAGQPMTKEQKKVEAERQKRLQQEKLRASELNHQIATFSKALVSSVIDTPMMCKLGANTFKVMMRADHCAVAFFKEYPETGEICIVDAEAAGTKEPPKPPTPPTQTKQPVQAQEVIIQEPDPTKPPPKPPLPPNPPKPGILLPIVGQWIDWPFIFQMKELKQPIMIPDVSKFPETQVTQFATAFGIKSMLVCPLLLKEEVKGVVIIYTINNFQVFSPLEITHLQKAIAVLAKSIETAPPKLPDDIKKKVITKINKAEDSKKLINYYNTTFEDVFTFIIGELSENEENLAEIEELIKFMDERKKEDSPMRKLWFKIAKFLEFDGDKALLTQIALQENYTQAEEYATEQDIYPPPGFDGLIKYLKSTKKFPKLEEFGVPKETIEAVDDEINKALRGNLIYKDETKASLINDIEQSEMIANFVSVPAAIDFRQHIKAAIEDTDIPEEVEIPLLLDDLSYEGMKEIVKSVASSMAEKYLFELPNFLEQPESVQLTQTEALTNHIKRRFMANLVGILKGKSTDWSKSIVEKLRNKAKEAAKKRAVLVGKLSGSQEEEEE